MRVFRDLDNAARAARVASAGQRQGVVKGYGRVRGTELVGVVVRGRRGRQGQLRAVLVPDAHGRRHGRLDELVTCRALAKERFHMSSPALVHHDHLDDLLTLDECF